MVGFSAEQFGLSIPEMVKLYEALPLKEAVVEKWLYGNAGRVLRLD
jgi:predicted TIM-barrel fold metal-dependent hydrolase